MITLTINNRVAVSLGELPPPVAEQLQERLTFPNPVWLENEKRGYSNWKVPETLRLFQLSRGRLVLPRGFIGQALGLLQEADGEGVCLVLSDRKAHCETLAEMLAQSGLSVSVLTGDLSIKKRQEIIGAVNGGQVKVLATGQCDSQSLGQFLLGKAQRF